MTEHPELIALCTNCVKEDCPEGTCSDYKAIERRIRLAHSRSRYHTAEPVPTESGAICTVETLRRVNRAIEAFEELLRDPACDVFLTGRGIADKLLEQMRRQRFSRCQHLIDWNIIVELIGDDDHEVPEMHT